MRNLRDDYPFVHIAGAATTVVIGAAARLIRITVNTTGAGTITAYNAASSALSTSGVVGAILKSSIVENTYEYNCVFPNGITVVTGAAAQDITVVYAPN